MGIDKIPINMMSEIPGDETFQLGTVVISKGEYANAQKINQIIDELTEFQQAIEIDIVGIRDALAELKK